MESRIAHPKPGLQLRRIGQQYMIVEVSAGNANMSNVYSLNRTAARLWELLSAKDSTPAELADELAEFYGIDSDTALRDVERQLKLWREFGLIE